MPNTNTDYDSHITRYTDYMNGRTPTTGSTSSNKSSSGLPPYTEYLSPQSQKYYDLEHRKLDVEEKALKANEFGANMGTAKFAFSVGTDLLNAWNSFKQLDLQKEAFKFNKDMATKEFNLAKESYDRKKKRSQGIAAAMRGE